MFLILLLSDMTHHRLVCLKGSNAGCLIVVIVLLQESINSSLLNLLTYPWINKRVNEGTLNLHGGYYNFIDCTFEKWTLVYREGLEGGSKYAIKNRSTWS
jgi:hypothetical protein